MLGIMESLRQKTDRIGLVEWTRKKEKSQLKTNKRERPARERIASEGKKVNKVKSRVTH